MDSDTYLGAPREGPRASDERHPTPVERSDRRPLAVHLPPVADGHHEHRQYLVVDGIEDAIIADADPQDAVPAVQRDCAGRPWVVFEAVDGLHDATQYILSVIFLRVRLAAGFR